MVKLTFPVLSNLVDDAIQRATNPTNGTELLGIIGPTINDVL